MFKKGSLVTYGKYAGVVTSVNKDRLLVLFPTIRHNDYHVIEKFTLEGKLYSFPYGEERLRLGDKPISLVG